MTKTTHVYGITAVLFCLFSGNAYAEDTAKQQPTQPVVTNDQEDQTKPKPKEDVASPNDSKSDTSKEEPECN